MTGVSHGKWYAKVDECVRLREQLDALASAADQVAASFDTRWPRGGAQGAPPIALWVAVKELRAARAALGVVGEGD